MKKTILILVAAYLLSVPTFAQLQLDSLQANRLVTRTTMYGVGYTNIYDTYLSPVEYTGIEARISRETIRMTKLFDGNVSAQSFFQANLAYTENKSETNNTFSGLVNWNYALHYRFPINDNLKILAGGLGEVNGGFVYNLRNTNNPASAKAYINLGASGMIIYRMKFKNYPVTWRYQANIPFVGLMFSPNYGQSYYEIFSLKNHDNIVQFTSLHNQPSIRQMLSADLPIGSAKLRISYLWDVQQSKVNQLKTHTYSHIVMFGFVKELYKIPNKEREALPANLKAY
jgi:Protein of unknown function (DUF3316).